MLVNDLIGLLEGYNDDVEIDVLTAEGYKAIFQLDDTQVGEPVHLVTADYWEKHKPKPKADTYTGLIHIALFEPNEGGSSVGSYEWRLDRAEAEKEFRRFRGEGGTALLYVDIPVVGLTPEEITEWVDSIYWDHPVEGWSDRFGSEPVKVYSRS